MLKFTLDKRDLAEVVKSNEQFRLLQETQIVDLELDLAKQSHSPVSKSVSYLPFHFRKSRGRGLGLT